MSKWYVKRMEDEGSPLFNNVDEIEWDDDTEAIMGNPAMPVYGPHWMVLGADMFDTLAEMVVDIASHEEGKALCGYRTTWTMFHKKCWWVNRKFTRENVVKMTEYFLWWNGYEHKDRAGDRRAALCELFSFLSGKQYSVVEIHGNTPDEWNYLYTPTMYSTNDHIKFMEALYFNTGTKWMMTEETDADGQPDWEYFQYIWYTPYRGDEEEEKRLLAKFIDCSENDIVICEEQPLPKGNLNGWRRLIDDSPSHGETVLVWSPEFPHDIAYVDLWDKKLYLDSEDGGYRRIKDNQYWMPLPKEPDFGKEN